MKQVYILLAMLAIGITPALANYEKEVKTEASEVTLYLDGAQVMRKTNVNLPQGRSKLKFVNLSPYIDDKSLQVDLKGEVTVLSVNYQTSTAEALKKLSEAKEKELDKLNNTITKQQIDLGVVKDEIGFLNENKKIGGTNTGFSLATLIETANYYRTQMTQLKTKESDLIKEIRELETKRKLLLEGEDSGAKEPDSMGEVVVEVETMRPHTISAQLSYYVKNASWFPSYDIRATDISEPINLIYKANIKQNTKEDWNKVRLTISSGNPTQGSTLPELQTYLLDYHIAPPRYSIQEFHEVKGIVTDITGEPLFGASVEINNSTIGTITNEKGEFSLPIPNSSAQLKISYIGFTPQVVPIRRANMHISLQEDRQILQENTVVGFGSTQSRRAAQTAPHPMPPAGQPQIEDLSAGRPARLVENQLTVEFKVSKPYDIPSSNRSRTIEVEHYSLPAQYEYYSIPKITKETFLLASITNWEEYKLLAGEANIFFENSFVGKTVLDTRNLSDTLNISLGRDKSVIVDRELSKEKSSKRSFSSKREENRNWKLTVRNTKGAPIQFILLDQVPVSRNSDIEVSIQDLSGAEFNDTTGEVKWKFSVKPSQQKELNLHYRVRYPNNQRLLVE